MAIWTKSDKGEGGVEKWSKIPDVLSAWPLIDSCLNPILAAI